MRRIIMVMTVAVMLVALMGISAGPALADHRHFDNDVFDDHDHEGLFDDRDHEGLFERGGPICPGEDEDPELVFGAGFVCVDRFDHRDFGFDHRDFDHRHHDDDFLED